MFLDLDWQRHDINEAEEVYCMVKPLEMWALEKLGNFFGAQAKEGEDLEELQNKFKNINPIGNKDFIQLAKEILPKHAKELTNLEIRIPGEERRTATIDDLVNVESLMIAAVTLLGKIISISSLTLVERDKLKK